MFLPSQQEWLHYRIPVALRARVALVVVAAAASDLEVHLDLGFLDFGRGELGKVDAGGVLLWPRVAAGELPRSRAHPVPTGNVRAGQHADQDSLAYGAIRFRKRNLSPCGCSAKAAAMVCSLRTFIEAIHADWPSGSGFRARWVGDGGQPRGSLQVICPRPRIRQLFGRAGADRRIPPAPHPGRGAGIPGRRPGHCGLAGGGRHGSG
jgi:hypothetical protein